ncbi:hypothetical protein GQ53DRAFT_763662 [Thozetella sp. PMI_491]|nr:hypothetical protein GQ53DRAFT_763662 [Thozetella sp. PMI_491]
MVNLKPAACAAKPLPSLPVELWEKIWDEALAKIGPVVIVPLLSNSDDTAQLRDKDVKIYGYSDIAKFSGICSSARHHMLRRRQHCMTLAPAQPHEDDRHIYIDFCADIFVLNSLKDHMTPLIAAFETRYGSQSGFTRSVQHVAMPSAMLRRLDGVASWQTEFEWPSAMPLLHTFTMTLGAVETQHDAKSLREYVMAGTSGDLPYKFWTQEPEKTGGHAGKFGVDGVYIDPETYRGGKLLLAHADPGFCFYFCTPIAPGTLLPRVKIWQRGLEVE